MKDFLIVGFGIAGLTFSNRLQQNNLSFDVISDSSQKSSRVAGGVLNPVALKRYKLAWNADSFLREAISFYKSITYPSTSDFEPVPIHKIFSSIQDQNDWMLASDNFQLSSFLNDELVINNPEISKNYKSGIVKHTFLLDLKNILERKESEFLKNSCFIKASFDYEKIDIQNNKITYQNNTYRYIVFCEGFGVVQNPYFNWLPIYGNKGEYIIFHAPDLNSNHTILKSKYFIIPVGNDCYKFGATYSRDNLNDIPTPKARSQLKENLSALLNCNFEIVDQIAGVRPTVSDRKPILGKHPKYQNMYVFNGFGSRGIISAPSLSKDLLLHITKNQTLDKDVDISRFLKFYL
ncbi:NAD(P)/FAD-dependent oxidoreductase [Psychroflexus aestuariivivens]|uniref:NAD(P)/FAD-dependent oxidoreductase n=1 Tax=Psychroflexus aestuariivivens TaxID=1795040 RepID=UPI000FD86605|nr:FAD-dependent oxidoreductase [Psychroflexus aestuariivivens]